MILYILSESNGFNCLFPNAVSSILGYKIIENVQLKNAKMCCVKTLTGIKICWLIFSCHFVFPPSFVLVNGGTKTPNTSSFLYYNSVVKLMRFWFWPVDSECVRGMLRWTVVLHGRLLELVLEVFRETALLSVKEVSFLFDLFFLLIYIFMCVWFHSIILQWLGFFLLAVM